MGCRESAEPTICLYIHILVEQHFLEHLFDSCCRCILLLPQRRGITQVAFGEAVITPPCRCHEGWRSQQGFPQSSGELAQVSFSPVRSRQIRVAVRISIPTLSRSDTVGIVMAAYHQCCLQVLCTGVTLFIFQDTEKGQKRPFIWWGLPQ